jgi:hypothetical protein
VWRTLVNLDFNVKNLLPFLTNFVEQIQTSLTTHPTALHVRSEELLTTVYSLGGLLPAQVQTEAKIDNLFQADHLITCTDG